MEVEEQPFSELLSNVVDNRGKTCPTASSGIPLIATNCIRNELLYPTYEKVRFVSQETYDNWFRDHPQAGDIIFVNKATPGRVCMVPDPVDFCIAQDMVAVRANSDKVYPKYLFAALRSPSVQEKIGQMHVGTLIPHFKKGDFNKLLLPIPPRKTQEFIGDVYFDLSAKIELNRRMNGTLEAVARALFQSWFVDFDPARAKLDGRPPAGIASVTADLFPAAFQDSALGPIPDGWKVVAVGETCDRIFSGGTPSTQTAHYWGGIIPWLSSGETRRRFIIDTEKTITAAGVANSSTRNARAGATVIASAGQGHTRGQTSLLTFESYINQSVVALEANQSISSDLFLFFDLARRYDEFRQLSDSHSSRGSLTTKLLAGVRAVLPPRPLIARFDEAVRPIVDQITGNIQQSRTLAALRDTLLPKLLSGELGVNGFAEELDT